MEHSYYSSAPLVVKNTITLATRYKTSNLVERSFLLDEVKELLGGVEILTPDDLIEIVECGYRGLPREARGDFMRKILIILHRVDVVGK